MRILAAVFTILLLAISIQAESIIAEGSENGAAGYYTPGIINPAEGTVEITAVPSRPGAEFQDGWYSAFTIIPGQSGKNFTLLGLYTASGAGGNCSIGVVARCSGISYGAASNDKSFLKPGVPVNIAFSWGAEGVKMYVNGKLHAHGQFHGELGPMPALFKLGEDSPFNVRSAKISTRQLPMDKITGASTQKFAQTDDTSFLWNKGNAAEYFVTDFSRKASPVLMPVWRLTNAMSAAGEDASIALIGLNLTSNPATYKVNIASGTIEEEQAVTNQEVMLSASAKFIELRLALPVKDTGFYKLNTKITGTGQSAEWKSAYMIYPANDEAVKDGKFIDLII